MGAAILPFEFTQANATASQSAVGLSIDADSGLTEFVFPWEGAIVGVAVASENARTAGTLTVEPYVNAAATGLQAVVNATNSQRAYATQPKDTTQFAAGARIGCRVTTDAAWAAGTTPSVVATVYVQKGKSET